MSNPSLNIEINALVNGLEDILSFQEQIRATGLELTSIAPSSSTATDALASIVAAASETDATFNTLGASTQTIADNIGQLSPALEEASDQVGGFSQTVTDLGDVSVDLSGTLGDAAYNVDAFGQATSSALDEAGDSVGKFSDNSIHLDDLSIALDGVASASSDAVDSASQVADVAASISDVSADASSGVTDVAEAIDNLADTSGGVGDLDDSLQSVAQTVEDTSGSTRTLVDAIDGINEVTDDATDSFNKIVDASEETDASFGDLVGSTEEVIEEIDRLNPSVDSTRDGVAAFTETVVDLSTVSSSLSDTLGEAGEGINEFGQSTTQSLDETTEAAIVLGATAENLDEVDLSLQNITDSASTTAAEAQALADAIAGAADSGDDLTGTLEDTADTAGGATDSLDDLAQATEEAAAQLDTLNPNADVAEDEIIDLTSAVDDLTGAAQNLNGDLGAAGQNLDEFGNNAAANLDQAAGAAQNLGGTSEDLGNLDEALADTSAAAEEAARVAAELAAAAAEVSDETGEAEGSTSKFGAALAAFAGNAAPETSSRITDLSANLSDMREQAGTSEGRVQLLGAGLGKLAGLAGLAAGALIAVIGAINLKEAADYAARLETLSKVVETVGNNAGYTTDEIKGYEQELKGLGISSIAAKEAITQMASAGLELGDVAGNGTSQIAEMADAAQNLSIVSGQSASEALSQLIINIKQLDTEGLRNMGITLDQTAAQAAYAQQLGVSAGSLTAAQNQQAAMNYVLSEASKLAGVYGDSMETVEAKIGKLGAQQEKLQENVGNMLLPAYRQLINATIDFTKETNASIEANVNAEAAGASLAKATKLGTDVIFGGFGLVVEVVTSLSDEFFSIVDSVSEVGQSVYNSFMAIIDVLTITDSSITPIEVSFKVLAFGAAAIADGFKIVEIVVRSLVVVVADASALILSGFAAIARVADEDVANSIDKVAERFKGVSAENAKASQEIIEGFEQGNSSIGKFVEGLQGIKPALDDLGTGSNFTELSDEIIRLTGAQKDLTSVELDTHLAKITARVKELGESSALTEIEQTKLGLKLGVIAKNIETEYNDAFKGMGVTLGELNSGVSEAASAVSGGLNTLATNARTTGEVFNQAFNFSVTQATNISDLSLLTESVELFGKKTREEGKESKESLALLGEATVIARSRFEELFDSQLEAAKTQKDFENLSTEVEKFGRKMVEAGLLSEAELQVKLEAVSEAAEEMTANLMQAGDIKSFEALGVDIEELRTGFSAAFGDMLDGLDQLTSSSTATAEGLGMAFESAFKQVESFEQFSEIKQKINEAGEAGKLFGDDLVEANTKASEKFKELFDSALEAASTKEDFDELTATLNRAGEEGTLSAGEIATAFEDIRKKVEDANGSILTMAEQARAASQASVNLAQAETDVVRAKIDVTKAELAYTEANNKYREEGTELARAEMEVKKLDLVMAREVLELAELKYETEVAGYDLLIAKQQALNAEKRLEIDINNEKLIAAANASAAEATAKAVVVEKTQQAYAKQQLVVIATEQAALRARAFAENLQSAATNASKTKTALDSATMPSASVAASVEKTGFALKSWSMENIQKEMGKYVKDSKEAERIGKQIYESAQATSRQESFRLGTIVTNYGAANKLLGEQANMAAARDEKEARRAASREEEAVRQQGYAKAAEESENRRDEAANRQLANIQTASDRLADSAARANAEAEFFAETGLKVSLNYQFASREGLSEAEQGLLRLKETAQDIARSALEMGSSFLKSSGSIQAELLRAQGKEAELLEYTYKIRQSELATEYELLKVKLQIAQATAVAAGVDTSSISKMLGEVQAAYTASQAALTQLEALEKAKLNARVAETAQMEAEKRNKESVSSAARNQAAAQGSNRYDSPADSSRPSAPSQIIRIEDSVSGANASMTDADKENLIDIITRLKNRSA